MINTFGAVSGTITRIKEVFIGPGVMGPNSRYNFSCSGKKKKEKKNREKNMDYVLTSYIAWMASAGYDVPNINVMDF